jgi:hypothetical protein
MCRTCAKTGPTRAWRAACTRGTCTHGPSRQRTRGQEAHAPRGGRTPGAHSSTRLKGAPARNGRGEPTAARAHTPRRNCQARPHRASSPPKVSPPQLPIRTQPVLGVEEALHTRALLGVPRALPGVTSASPRNHEIMAHQGMPKFGSSSSSSSSWASAAGRPRQGTPPHLLKV